MLKFDCEHAYESGFVLNAKFETNAQVTGLVGPSGSGKTTILNLIAGLSKPERGTIQLGSRVLTNIATKVIERPENRNVGMLFQEPRLFPHMSVEKNIRYGINNQSANNVDFATIVETLELSDLLSRYPKTLSGGQKQRVALARAIASSPQVLLLDEPLTSVEHNLRERISSFISRVVKQFEIPTILVSHDGQFVSQLADHVIEIHSGKILESELN